MSRLRPSRAAWLLPPVLLAASAVITAPARASTVKVLAQADASVRIDHARKAFGRAARLRVDARPASSAYLRFRLSGTRGRVVEKAALWVYLARRARWAGIEARMTDGRAWREQSVAWRTRPRPGSPLGRARTASGRWKKIDVTPAVTGDGTVEIALVNRSSAGALLASREAGEARAPRLHLSVYSETAPRFPIRGAFYSPSYPDAWAFRTRYHPVLGRYDGNASSVMARHLGSLAWANVQAAIVDWDRAGSDTDARDRRLLAVTRFLGQPLRWAVKVQSEARGSPSSAAIAAQLLDLDRRYGRDRAYLRMRGRPVAYLELGPGDGCTATRRWVRANAKRFYLVAQTWPGYERCDVAPSDWYHRPAGASTAAVGRSSYTITPATLTNSPQVVRDLPRWNADVRGMVSSRARWQLVSSFNGWADGSAVEPASEWASPSGQGHYLDALRAGGAEPPATSTVVAAVADMACSVAQRTQAEQQGRTDICRSAATAAVARAMNPALVIAAGDLQYEQATLEDFQQAYEPSWGSLKSITRPALGNHEYCSYVCPDPQAAVRAGYFTYFGSGAGTPGQGWYSYDIGGWHVAVLNSECGVAGGCEVNSPQERWLRADLAAHPTACTLAYWHRPLFSGGREGENPLMGTIWDDLYRAGVELVINGHQHQYERFAPQTSSRAPDGSGGVLEIVAGTGGRSHLAPVAVRPNTVVHNADTFGVLRLDLRPLGFSWRFQPAAGSGTFTDSGSRNCH
jgi:hypothetical protein